MLVVDRAIDPGATVPFAEFPAFLNAGDAVVITTPAFPPARLIGHRVVNGRRGALVEALLVRQVQRMKTAQRVGVLAKPGRWLRSARSLSLARGYWRGVVTAIVEEGRRHIRFSER